MTPLEIRISVCVYIMAYVERGKVIQPVSQSHISVVCVCVCVVLFDVLLVGCPPIYGGAHKISVAGRGDTEVYSNLVVTPRKNKLVRELAGFRA